MESAATIADSLVESSNLKDMENNTETIEKKENEKVEVENEVEAEIEGKQEEMVDDDYYTASEQSSDESESEEETEDSDCEMMEPLTGDWAKDRAALNSLIMMDSDDEEDGKYVVTKNEVIPDNLPAPEPIPVESLPNQYQLEEIGVISSVVDNLIIITTSRVNTALDIGSILWFEDRLPVGRVDDVFGPVSAPFYSIRFLNSNDAAGFKNKLSCKVYFSKQFASFVLPSQMKTRGTDASSKFDEEPPEDEVEFSDDEKEAEYKRNLKNKRAGKSNENLASKSVNKKQQASVSSTGSVPIYSINNSQQSNANFFPNLNVPMQFNAAMFPNMQVPMWNSMYYPQAVPVNYMNNYMNANQFSGSFIPQQFGQQNFTGYMPVYTATNSVQSSASTESTTTNALNMLNNYE